MNKLLDCDKHVENGYQIGHSNDCIIAHETTGIYFRGATFYKSFSLMGLHEARRLVKIAKEKTALKKIDSQVIFDFFENKSILNVCGFTLKMYEVLIMTLADMNLDTETD